METTKKKKSKYSDSRVAARILNKLNKSKSTSQLKTVDFINEGIIYTVAVEYSDDIIERHLCLLRERFSDVGGLQSIWIVGHQ